MTEALSRALTGIVGGSNDKGTGTWVAVAGSSPTTAAASTTDVGSWTSRGMPVSAVWTSVAFGRKRFVAVNNSGSTNSAAITYDGRNWSSVNMPNVSGNQWKTITFGNNLFVAAATGTVAASSPDGVTWTAITLPVSATQWKDSAFGGGTFILMPNTGTSYAYSTDGVNWSTGTFPSGITNNSCIAYGNGQWLVFGLGTANYFASTNGTTWVTRTMPTSGDHVAAYYHESGSRWNVFLYGTPTYRSSLTGGQNSWSGWESGATSLNWSEVAWGRVGTTSGGSGFAIAVGLNSTYSPYTATPTSTWSSSTIANQAWNSIAYGKL